jgi:hypothetical protein
MSIYLIAEPFERKFRAGLFTFPTVLCTCTYFVAILFPLILAAATNRIIFILCLI